jgi:MFS family permease
MAIFWSIFTLVTALAKNFIGVLIPRAFVGMGEAGFVPGGVAMISQAYPKKSTAKVMGIFNLAGPIGAALGVMLGGILSHQYGWRMPFYIFAIPGIILAIFAFFMKDYKTEARPSTINDFGKSIVRLLKVRTLIWFYLGYAAFMFMFTSSLAWVPSYIMRVRNMDEAAAGALWGVLGLLAIVGAPLGGFLADAWHKKNPGGRILLPAIAWLLATIFNIIVLLTNFNTIGIVCALLSGIAGAASFPALYTISQDVVHTQDKGLSMGIAIFSQYMLGGAWGPFVIGTLSDGFGGGASGLSGALMLSAAGGFLGFVFVLIGSRFYKSDAESVGIETVFKEG